MDTSTETDTEPVVEAVAPEAGATSRGGVPRSDPSGPGSAAARSEAVPSGVAAVAVAGDGRGAVTCGPRSWRS
ncbi:hypothetical protein ADL06_16040 [Streptomyces sp. NRRL F-6491]|nr:hypothetical protein ADL06_16040 [Streptomyces sp. NRRL F-6491]KOX36828.1 hypothetical protein ADL08_31335 [Streptomyces sp. NRRL F-6492]